MKVQMMNNKLIYDLDDMNKRYEPDEKGVYSAPVLLEDIGIYLKSYDEIVIRRARE